MCNPHSLFVMRVSWNACFEYRRQHAPWSRHAAVSLPFCLIIFSQKLSSRRVHLQEPRWSPTLVPALAGATLVRSGQHHTLALMRTGAVLTAGRPTYGRLGRSGVDPASDDPLPEANPVEGLDGVQVSGLAAGGRQPALLSVPTSMSRCHGCLERF